jgi:hypothetical protein
MALLAVVLVAGCGDSGESDGAATSTATASVSETTEPPIESPSAEPTATSALPPLPAEATENTPEGAEAFIRYWFDVTNDLYMRPDAGVVPLISHPDCVACQRTESTITELAATDSTALTEPFLIESMERIGGGPPDVTRFNMVADAPANATVDADGNESNPGEAATVEGVGAAYWDGERWTLYGLELEPRQ